MTTFTPTPEQQAAIDFDNTMVVTACPGSGKTAVMKEKIRRITPELPNHKGVIAITFTIKASQELKSRCKEGAHDTKQSFFGTIDSFCLKEIILPFLSRLWGGVPSERRIVKRLDEPYLFLFDEEYRSPTAEDVQRDDGFRQLYDAGFLWMNSFAALALLVLNNSESARRYVKARYSHVFIDEYQDSSAAQHELFLKLLDLGLKGVAVGDISQSIYEFRGGNPRLLKSLVSDTGTFRHFEIKTNHRCHPSIANYATKLIDPSFEITQCEDIRVFRRVLAGDLESGAKEVSGWISDWLNTGSWGIEKAADIAILAMKERSLQLLAKGLGLNYRVYSNTPLDDVGSESADLYARLLAYKYGALSTMQDLIDDQFQPALLQGVSLSSLRRKLKALRGELHAAQLVQAFRDFAEMLGIVVDDASEKAVENILADEGLKKQFETVDDNEIQVMTLHKSKGLEFKVVFHFDLEEWSFPYREYVAGDWDNAIYPNLNQDTNLHYVGITRAENCCCLIRVSLRQNARGNFSQAHPSYFLKLPQLEGLYLE